MSEISKVIYAIFCNFQVGLEKEQFWSVLDFLNATRAKINEKSISCPELYFGDEDIKKIEESAFLKNGIEF